MRKVVFGLFIAVAAGLAACSGSRETAQGQPSGSVRNNEVSEEKVKEFEFLFIEALKQKMIGNPRKAVSFLSACLEINPNSSAAMYELANLHIANNDLTSASLLLEKATTLNPSNKWYKLMLARVYAQVGKDAEAALLYGQLSTLEPDNQEYLYLKAMQLSKAKKYEEAVRTFRELEAKTGINEQISLAIQEVFLEAGKVKEAFAEIQRLIRSQPGDARYYGLLADLYKDQGDMDNALAHYLKVLEIDPGNGFVHFSLAAYYLEKGDTAKAFAETKEGFNSGQVDLDTKLQLYLLHTGSNAKFPLTPEQNGELIRIIEENHPGDFRVYSIFAEYLLRNKRNSEAREQLEKVVAAGVTEYAVWEQILYLDNELQDWEALLRHSRNALELYPNQPQIYFFQAIAALQLERYEEAVSLSDEGMNYVVDNPMLKGQFVFLKGEARYKMRQIDEAFGLFDQAIEMDPENYMALNNYAYYLSLAGKNLEKAERMSGKVIERFPDNATYLDTYAWVLFKKKDYSLARFYMQTALEKSEEENATLLEHYGDILYMLGRTGEALGYWEKALQLGPGSEILRNKIREKRYFSEEP